MATNLVPIEWKLHSARQFIESVEEAANTAWYVWFADHMSEDDPGDVYDMTLDTTVGPYRNMVMGKRVAAADTALLVRRINWTSGTAYTMYDHGDPIMHTKEFYVITEAGSYYHVFKCLDNNRGANSTVEPDFSDIDATDAIYQTSDGYRWRYMYTVDSAAVNKFATSSYFPVEANSEVVAAAVPGAIDIVRVYSTGEGYGNYLTGTFDGSHVRVGGNTRVYSVSSNAAANAATGYYTGCYLYISAGTGAGQYKEVTHYFSNNSGKFVVIEDQFTVAPTNGSEFEIYPKVAIYSGGDQTLNAAARGLVNAVGNSIYRVEMLDRGSGYTYATANVIANATVGVTTAANVVPVYSPPGGHGSDAAAELGASRAAITVQLVTDEEGTIPATNRFRQVGILRDPKWANVELELSSGAGSFTAAEGIKKYREITMATDATVIAGNSTITSNSGYWDQKLAANDYLIVTGETTDHQLVRVTSVTNSTYVVVDSNLSFSCTEARVSLGVIDPTTANVITQPSSTRLLVDIDSGTFAANDKIIGVSSGATANVASVWRNGVEKGFGTFVQCWKYRGTYDSGEFTQNEYVYQGNSWATATAVAQLHSAVSDDGAITVLTTNQVGSFATGTLKGANSGALFTITAKYTPEIKHGSGRVTYVENIDPIERSDSQTETFKLILEF